MSSIHAGLSRITWLRHFGVGRVHLSIKMKDLGFFAVFSHKGLHPGRLTWNLLINQLERKMIFQTSMIMFHVNLPGCSVFATPFVDAKIHVEIGQLLKLTLWPIGAWCGGPWWRGKFELLVRAPQPGKGPPGRVASWFSWKSEDFGDRIPVFCRHLKCY